MKDLSYETCEREPPTVILGQSGVARLGLDLGTNTTVMAASVDGAPHPVRTDMLRTVVGFPRKGILPGILPEDAEVLFGDEAIEHRLALDLVRPIRGGVVHDARACRLFAEHLGGLISTGSTEDVWGVVGTPANMPRDRERDLRAALSAFLGRLLLVPEPFLAAMGLRDDEAFAMYGTGEDPTRHSLVVDIGAGTTDLCLVRGYFPTADDLITLQEAGDAVDLALHEALSRRYPDVRLHRVAVQKIKEKFSFVTGCSRRAIVRLYVEGRLRALDLSDLVGGACERLLDPIVDGIRTLLRRCDSECAEAVLRNIIITGGGSQIQGLTERIEKLLHEDDYDCARCVKPMNYKRLVARGALRIAESVREDQWQLPLC